MKKSRSTLTQEEKIEASWKAALEQLHQLTGETARIEMDTERLREIVEPGDGDFSEQSAEFVEMTQFEIPGVELDYDQLYLLGRAKTKFDEYDVDKNGTLGSDEVLEIADWVWNNFEPNGAPLSQSQRLELATKLLEKYDDDGDGTLSFEEFVDWFLVTSKILDERRRKESDVDDSTSDHMEQPMDVIERIYESGVTLTLKEALRKARKKYDQTDKDNSGLLEGAEVGDIAEWALRTFQPGGRRVEDYEKMEFADKLIALKDSNGDKKIDFDEFSEWFVESLVDISKANKLVAEFDKHEEMTLHYNMEVLTVGSALSKLRIKFRELDTNGTGFLEGEEVRIMGNWVWTSFAPLGKSMTERKIQKITRNLIAQRDLNKDLRLDFDEFSRWFVDTCKYIYKLEATDGAMLAEFDQVSMSQSHEPAVVTEVGYR